MDVVQDGLSSHSKVSTFVDSVFHHENKDTVVGGSEWVFVGCGLGMYDTDGPVSLGQFTTAAHTREKLVFNLFT